MKIKIILLIFIILIPFHRKEYLEVNYLDIGQGDSILLSVNNLNILIDGGPDNSLLHRLGEVLPWYERKIDYLVISHYHADHFVGFIELLNKYEVDNILVTNHEPDNMLYKIFINELREKDLDVTIVNEGDRFIISEDVYFDIILADCIHEDYNDNSILLKFKYYDLDLLFTGDLTSVQEKTILNRDLESEILKVAHHGSMWSSSKEFLEVVKHEVCIIQSGIDNKFGHPHEEAMSRLENINCNIYNTQFNSTIKLTSNGYEYFVDF